MEINNLISNLKKCDNETYFHSLKVADFVMKLIENEPFNNHEQKLIYEAALLHDIGKINIDKNILFKESSFTQIEFEEMKKHSLYGYEIILSNLNDEKIARIVLEHHERCDGSGYPYHKSSNEILIESKIIAIADSYDAMKSKRRYKESLSDKEIIKIFSEDKNKYDQYFLEKMLKIINCNKSL